jgi:hypothetical protein
MKDSKIPEKMNQMIFIYNALQSGWSVRSIGDNSFEFCKKKNKKEIDLDKKSLKDFIIDNL